MLFSIAFLIISIFPFIVIYNAIYKIIRDDWIKENVLTVDTDEILYECYVFTTDRKNTTKIYHETVNKFAELNYDIISTYGEKVDGKYLSQLIEEFNLRLSLPNEKITCERYFITNKYYRHGRNVAVFPKDLFANRIQ
jgi:hypothetical protein